MIKTVTDMTIQEMSKNDSLILDIAKQQWDKVQSRDEIIVTWDNNFISPILCIESRNDEEMICITKEGSAWLQDTNMWNTCSCKYSVIQWLRSNEIESWFNPNKKEIINHIMNLLYERDNVRIKTLAGRKEEASSIEQKIIDILNKNL